MSFRVGAGLDARVDVIRGRMDGRTETCTPVAYANADEAVLT